MEKVEIRSISLGRLLLVLLIGTVVFTGFAALVHAFSIRTTEVWYGPPVGYSESGSDLDVAPVVETDRRQSFVFDSYGFSRTLGIIGVVDATIVIMCLLYNLMSRLTDAFRIRVKIQRDDQTEA